MSTVDGKYIVLGATLEVSSGGNTANILARIIYGPSDYTSVL